MFMKSFKLPADVKVFIQDSTLISTLNNSNSNSKARDRDRATTAISNTVIATTKAKATAQANIKAKDQDQDKENNNIKLNLNQDSIKVLFQKDNNRICINLPKELCLLKKGSILTLALRNVPSSYISNCSGDYCPVIPLSILKSVTNIEPNTVILSLLGTWINIISNILYGLSRGFHTNLLLSGVGFRAQKKDNNIEFKLGYSHLVNLPADPNIKLDIFKNTSLHLHGCSKEQLGNFAARIKHLRLPDSYKGKGVRVRGINLRLKEGKKT